MREKFMPGPDGTIRFDSLDDMPPALPLSTEFKALTDGDVAQRSALDPDAGAIPAGFWEQAIPIPPETKEQITLRLDPEVTRYFRSLGKGYQSRMNAVLKSYVRAQTK